MVGPEEEDHVVGRQEPHLMMGRGVEGRSLKG